MTRIRPTTRLTLSGRAGAVFLAGVLGAHGAAPADDVWVGRPGRKPLKYSAVRIRGDQAGELVFFGRAGNKIAKPIEQIARIHVLDQDELNRAEELFGRRKYADAIELYEQVAGERTRKWLKRYVTARLVTCYDAEGRLADAVRTWVDVLRVWPAYGVGLAPKKLRDKGSQAHKQALKVIAAALAGDLSPEAAQALKKLRAAIWRVEQDPRGSEAEGFIQAGRPTAAAIPDAKIDVVKALARASRLAGDGHHDEALAQIDRALFGIPERRRKTYLPRLLRLKAVCLLARGDALARAGKTDQARRQFIYGGLAAMHVITFYPESPSLIECLYLTGQCHEKIGRTKQAIALYRECREYAIGRGQAKWERQAARALERLDVKLN